jgi:hypothetical protein
MRLVGCLFVFGGLGFSGCLVDHKLGETAGDGSESGSGSGSGSSGASTLGTDDGSASQSNTSAQPSDDEGSSSSGFPGEGTDPGPTEGSSDDGVPDDCPLGPDSVRFQWEGSTFDPVFEATATESAALGGACAMATDVEQIASDPGEYVLHLSLECVLDGAIDGEPVVAQALSFAFDMYAADLDPAALPISTAQDVELRLATELWFKGWDTWFVITRGDGTILLDVVAGSTTDPSESGVGVEVAELLDGEPWHGGLVVNAAPTDCVLSENPCGGEPRAIELGWNGTPQTEVEVEQLGMITTDIEETWYRAHVRAAHVYTRPKCTDLPAADFRVSVWAEEP